MAKIVVGSSSLTQSFLLYPGLGPAMLDNMWIKMSTYIRKMVSDVRNRTLTLIEREDDTRS
jgi:hypothetical protein